MYFENTIFRLLCLEGFECCTSPSPRSHARRGNAVVARCAHARNVVVGRKSAAKPLCTDYIYLVPIGQNIHPARLAKFAVVKM